MKKFFTLLSLLIVMGMSANVMAQSTGEAPYPGATHTYSATTDVGTYQWSVTKGDLVTPVDASDLTLSDPTNSTATILWASTVSTTEDYYVRVVVTDNGCANTKILKVTPIPSEFHVTIVEDNETDCYDAAPTVDLNAGTIEYTHGSANLTYTVSVENAQGGWRFDIANVITPVVGGKTFTVVPTVDASSTGDAVLAGSTVTVDAGVASVKLNFQITKDDVETNATDDLGTAADFSAAVTVSSGQTGTGFTISDDNTGEKTGTTAVSRPHTTNITTN